MGKQLKSKSVSKIKSRLVIAASLLAMSVVSTPAIAKKLDERPSTMSMVADAVLVRPVLLGTTVVGTGLYVLTLPFSLIGGNAEEAGRQFVVVPFKATFVRCLGCTRKHMDNPDDYYDR